jgi:DNA-binding transcriptional ArsR family regulator
LSEIAEKIKEDKIKGGLYKLLGDLFQVLSSPTRIEILRLLLPCSPPPQLTFSEIMFGLRKNPNTINYHLERLMEYGMVAKTSEGKYAITEIGQLALKAEPADIIAVTEKAIENGKAKGYVISDE